MGKDAFAIVDRSVISIYIIECLAAHRCRFQRRVEEIFYLRVVSPYFSPAR